MKATTILMTAFLVLSVSCSRISETTEPEKPDVGLTEETEKPQALTPYVSKYEYAVYMAVLKKKATKPNFVVYNKTLDKDLVAGRLSNKPKSSVGNETTNNFNQKNKESSKIERKLRTEKQYKIISLEELNKIFDRDLGWKTFYEKFPESDGYYEFSRVGFSANGRRSLVFVRHSCGGLCGQAAFYTLIKKNGMWKIADEHVISVS